MMEKPKKLCNFYREASHLKNVEGLIIIKANKHGTN